MKIPKITELDTMNLELLLQSSERILKDWQNATSEILERDGSDDPTVKIYKEQSNQWIRFCEAIQEQLEYKIASIMNQFINDSKK